MMVLRMKACPQHSTGKEGVTISLNNGCQTHMRPHVGLMSYRLNLTYKFQLCHTDGYCRRRR
ncbi:hypothetical protein C5188_06345 [Serratia liquefaciens]|nr:hypothetical protein C5188_06345 [Serratia liquefaciens]